MWYAKYRLPDGRQVQRKLGPSWTGRGRPAAGYFTKRLAEDWLRSTLEQARRGTLPGLVRTGATFADAAAEFLRYTEQDRGCKPSTLRDYRSNLEAHWLPAFGDQLLEAVTPAGIVAPPSRKDRDSTHVPAIELLKRGCVLSGGAEQLGVGFASPHDLYSLGDRPA